MNTLKFSSKFIAALLVAITLLLGACAGGDSEYESHDEEEAMTSTDSEHDRD